MNFATLISIILLCIWCLAFGVQSTDAVTTDRGSRTYFTLLSSNIKFPMFSKEFTEAPGILSVGGIKQIWLDEKSQTLGVRLSRERLRPNGGGLGFSLTYWRANFGNESFLYRKSGPENSIAEYPSPTHSYPFFDLNAIYIA